VARFYRIWRIK